MDKLSELGFSIQPTAQGRLVQKYGCAAIVTDKGELTAPPGLVVKGELARLIDRGYQKFFKTADAEVPARPEEMSALARFENELKYALGVPALYNESLGSVSDRYLYDRIWHRDEGKQPQAWKEAAASGTPGLRPDAPAGRSPSTLRDDRGSRP